jgi:hypothetical protein
VPVAGAIIGAVATVGGGLIASSATKSAANTAAAAQKAANDAAIAEQQRQYNTTRTDLSPWMGAGQDALGQQMALLGLGGTDSQTQAIAALKNSPVYQSLFANGQEAILQNAAATGGLRGGNTQRSLADFGRDTLGQVYQMQLGNLGSVSGQGQNAAAGLGGLGANMANTNAQLLNNSGAAAGNAAYAIGGANAGLANTIGGVGANLANALFAPRSAPQTYLAPSVKSVMDSNPAIF